MRVSRIDPDLTRDLRRRVLRPRADPAGPLPGDGLADAVHFAAFDDDDRVISTCFVYPDPCPGRPSEPAWHLRQMATEPAFRRRGAAAAVLAAVVDHVAAHGGGLLWCNARVPALDFYRAQGLHAVGPIGPRGDPPVPHQRMWRDIPATRAIVVD